LIFDKQHTMQITLCFDFGNTRLKCAIFNNRELKDVIVLENDRTETIDIIIQKYQPAKSVLSSVIKHNEGVETLLSQKTLFHKIGHTSKLRQPCTCFQKNITWLLVWVPASLIIISILFMSFWAVAFHPV